MVDTNLEVGRCRELYGNGLTGSMPTELGRLRSLTWMYVRLSLTLLVGLNDGGYLPGGVGGCRALFGNDLTGSMPTELGLMTSMTRMYASCHPSPCVSRERW
jgi:hypothetical protein